MKLIPIIGMEVHVELQTKSKMFCGCENNPDEKIPNKNICEICLAHPGTLPLPNRQAIEWTVLIGKALGCQIRDISKFDRKHYFYPDLPKGYQISQYDEPIAEYGSLTLEFPTEDNPRPVARIGIRRAHLEEDTAKLYHNDSNVTLADFNRSGTPLVEIVTDPDIQTALEAKTFCQELQTLLRTLKVSGANMEKGQMRCEVNISLQEEGNFEIKDGVVFPLNRTSLNPKVEIKNINSFRAVEKAVLYEIQRQAELLEKGESWVQQTRGWDDQKEITVLQRTKENAADYRYFPEPDIPPFHPSHFSVSLPELPLAKRKRFHEEYGFSYADAKIMSTDPALAGFTEESMSELIEWLHSQPNNKQDSDDIIEQEKNTLARLAGGWITTKLMAILKEKNLDFSSLSLSPENFAEFISLVYEQKINSSNAQKLLNEMVMSGVDMDPTHLMEEKGYGQVSDEGHIQGIVEQTLQSYPDQVKQFLSGKEPVIKFLIGMVMKTMEGTGDPKIIEKILREKLSTYES